MTKFKVLASSYKVGGKWVASGVLWINNGATDEDVKLGPSESKFDSVEKANGYVHVLAKKHTSVSNNKKLVNL